MIKPVYYILAILFMGLSFSSCMGRDAEARQAATHFNEGIVFEEKNMLDSAAVCYLSAIGSLNPDNASNFEALGAYYNRIALLLFKSEINDEAEKMFREAIAFNSRLSDKGPLSESYRGLWKCFCVDNTESLDTTILKTVELIPYIQDKEELYKTKNGYIADTAGFSMLSLPLISKIKEVELGDYYPDFLPYKKNCKFRSCLHQKEKECGIIEAVKEGRISQERYQNYLKILTEISASRKY